MYTSPSLPRPFAGESLLAYEDYVVGDGSSIGPAVFFVYGVYEFLEGVVELLVGFINTISHSASDMYAYGSSPSLGMTRRMIRAPPTLAA